MQTLGYDVLNVGVRELRDGIPAFLQRIQASPLPFTSASFVYRDNGEQLFAPFAIKEHTLARGRKLVIGYIGVTAANSAFAREADGGRVVIIRDPVEAVSTQVKVVRRRADLVVLLANMSPLDLTRVLEASPGIDLVLASAGPRLSIGGALETMASVPVLYAGDQGKRMGEVRITLGAKGEKPVLTSGHVWLTKRYPADPPLQSLIDSTIARVNELNRRAAESRIAASAARAVPASGAEGAAAAPSRPPETAALAGRHPFVTAAGCAACHAQAFEVYAGSGHARAFDTLVKANQDFNPECVSCHVTGFHEPDGFVDARQTPSLANVQCEACHGNGWEHLADPQRPYGAVPPRRCFACHTKENSPDFVFFKYWHLIKH
ncbi:MAG TPA: multiheme c-type cytochrome [Candidatus Polarisedimenticolia bacterium]|nr:multiheme c-type cytochrome [Candidatus Polarisedimenticolia bacterium]